MSTAGGIFDADSEFAGLSDSKLQGLIEDASKGVVSRGRALLEIGRRAESRPELQERLFEWMGAETFSSKRWIGRVTLAWIAACCLGYSLKHQDERARLAEALRTWPESERELLLKWTQRENWFEGIN